MRTRDQILGALEVAIADEDKHEKMQARLLFEVFLDIRDLLKADPAP